MAYNLNMENIEIYNETRDMLPSISSTMLQVRCSEHASSKSVQSSPIWEYRPRFPRKGAANISQFTSFQNWNYSEDGFWSLCILLAGNEQTGRHTAPYHDSSRQKYKNSKHTVFDNGLINVTKAILIL